MTNEYTLPGGGLLKRTTLLTDEDRRQYVDFFAGKGIRIAPEQVQLFDGVVNIQMEGQRGRTNRNSIIA